MLSTQVNGITVSPANIALSQSATSAELIVYNENSILTEYIIQKTKDMNWLLVSSQGLALLPKQHSKIILSIDDNDTGQGNYSGEVIIRQLGTGMMGIDQSIRIPVEAYIGGNKAIGMPNTAVSAALTGSIIIGFLGILLLIRKLKKG